MVLSGMSTKEVPEANVPAGFRTAARTTEIQVEQMISAIAQTRIIKD
jgi:hypothetical protein